MINRTLGNVLKYGSALGLLVCVLWANWKPDSPDGLAVIWQRHVVQGEALDAASLSLALSAGLAALLLTFTRWYVLARAVGLPVRMRDALRLGLIGNFFNTLLPGAVGGDIIKATCLARAQDRRAAAVATVLIDRVIALWSLVWFVALLGAGFWLSGILQGRGAGPCAAIVGCAGAVATGTTLAWFLLGLLSEHRAGRFAECLRRLPKVGRPAAEFWHALWMYRCRPGSVFAALALSWACNVLYVLLFYFSVVTLGQPGRGREIPSLPQHFLIVPVGLVIQAVPLFPGGAGIGELGFGKLYAWLGCPAAGGVVGSLVQRVMGWLLGVLGYLVAVQMQSGIAAAQRVARSPGQSPGGGRRPRAEV